MRLPSGGLRAGAERYALPSMNLRQMEVFRAIMETGSVTGAARLLHVSQPAVTAVLRHAEDQLRFRLFNRVRGRLEPTPEARTLHAEIAPIFDRVAAVGRMIAGLGEARLGALHVVAIPALGMSLLPAAIGAFRAGRPQVTMCFEVRNRREMIEQVASGAADLGFGFLLPEHPRVAARAMARRDLVCLLRRGHPLCARNSLRMEDLVAEPMITYTSSQGLAPVINALLAGARLSRPPAIEVGLIVNAWSMVSEGAGMAIVDPHSGLEALFPGVVVRPFLPAMPVTLEAVHGADRPLSRLAEQFIQHLRQCLPPG
jgi:DNA-binding transcriptional LysR family regulator